MILCVVPNRFPPERNEQIKTPFDPVARRPVGYSTFHAGRAVRVRVICCTYINYVYNVRVTCTYVRATGLNVAIHHYYCCISIVFAVRTYTTITRPVPGCFRRVIGRRNAHVPPQDFFNSRRRFNFGETSFVPLEVFDSGGFYETPRTPFDRRKTCKDAFPTTLGVRWLDKENGFLKRVSCFWTSRYVAFAITVEKPLVFGLLNVGRKTWDVSRARSVVSSKSPGKVDGPLSPGWSKLHEVHYVYTFSWHRRNKKKT